MTVLGVTTNTDTELSQLVAGSAESKQITIKASAGALVRGQVMAINTTTYLWEKYNPSGSSGTNAARAILAEAVADDAAAQNAEAYFIGKYHADDLTWPTGITQAQKRTAILALQDKGVIVDETVAGVIGTLTTTTTTTT